MQMLKVNRKHFIDPDNIEKIVISMKDNPRIYQKSGYPRILKATEGLQILKNRLVNLGHTIYDFKLVFK